MCFFCGFGKMFISSISKFHLVSQWVLFLCHVLHHQNLLNESAVLASQSSTSGAMCDWYRGLWECALIRMIMPSPHLALYVPPVLLYRNVHHQHHQHSCMCIMYSTGQWKGKWQPLRICVQSTVLPVDTERCMGNPRPHTPVEVSTRSKAINLWSWSSCPKVLS